MKFKKAVPTALATFACKRKLLTVYLSTKLTPQNEEEGTHGLKLNWLLQI